MYNNRIFISDIKTNLGCIVDTLKKESLQWGFEPQCFTDDKSYFINYFNDLFFGSLYSLLDDLAIDTELRAREYLHALFYRQN